MSVRERSFGSKERIGMADLPMNVDHGAMTVTNVWAVMGLSIGSLAIAAVGALIFNLFWPSEYASWAGWRLVGVAFGISVGATALVVSWVTLYLAISTWQSHEWRKNTYAKIDMRARLKTNNVQVERTITAWELVTDRPLHMLGLALSVHERVIKGEESPFSERKLLGDGNVWVGGVQLGKVTPAVAQEASKLFADVGLVKGRQTRSAGRWTATSEQDVIQALTRGWARRGHIGEIRTGGDDE